MLGQNTPFACVCVLCSLATCPFVVRFWATGLYGIFSMNDFLFVAIYFRKHTETQEAQTTSTKFCALFTFACCFVVCMVFIRVLHRQATTTSTTTTTLKKWVKRRKQTGVSNFLTNNSRIYIHIYTSLVKSPNEYNI